jgi:hypothetical protein
MSQHHFASLLDGHPVLVVAGYDRPLRELFVNVYHGADDGGEETLYSSIRDPARDWADPWTVLARLAELHIAVPATLLRALVEDQREEAGNKLVFHYFERPPEVVSV